MWNKQLHDSPNVYHAASQPTNYNTNILNKMELQTCERNKNDGHKVIQN